MADNILRLRVDSQEYDNKIKRAAEGIQQYAQKCREVGGTLEHLDEGVLEFVQALGKMETVSKTAKGSLSEMTKAFTELSVQYNKLTDEERNSPFGRELSKQLEIMKGRISDAKKELKDIDNELKDSKSIMEQFKEKLTVNIDAMKLLELGLKAAKGALDVAKEGFMSSEANVDEWGRTVESARDVYEGFLTSINTGDISGFLSRIDDIVAAARTAYDELDKLGTMKTIQAPQISAQQKEIERMRAMLRTGRYIEVGDGRKSSQGYKTGDLLSDADKKRIERMLENGMKSLTKLVDNEVKQTSNTIDALFSQQAQKIGISLDEFKKGTSSWAEFSKRMEMAREYQKFEAQHTTSSYTSGGPIMFTRDGVANPYAAYKNWADFRVDKEGDGSFQELVKLIQQRDQQQQQNINTIAQAYRTINRVEGITSRIGDTGGSGSGTGNGETNVEKELTIQQQISELEKEALNASKERRVRIAEIIQDLDRQLQKQKELVASLHQVPIDPKSIKAGDPSKMGITLPVTIKEETLQQQVQKIADAARAAMANTDIADPMLAKFQEVFVDSNALGNLMKTAIENGLDTADIDFTGLKEQLKKGLDIDDSALRELVDKINEKLKAIGKDPIKLDFDNGSVTSVTGNLTKDAKQNQQAWSAAASAVSSLSSALQSLEDPSAKIAGIVGQAVANIALGFAQATASPATGAAGVFGWIAAATAGLATMLTTITSIKSVTKGGFAEGGIVPGNSYSGDRLNTATYGINSGELILNKAQQNSIAQQFEGGPFSNFQLTSRVSGRDLVLTINNQQTVNNKPKLNFK